MRTYLFGGPILGLAFLAVGCVYSTPNTDNGGAVDSFFHDRHGESAGCRHDPMMQVAREMTSVEDDLRRDGTITVKTPDVWGDGNLMYFLQEFDGQLATTTTKFTQTLQAYLGRSDSLDLQGTAALGAALNNSNSSPSPTAPTPVLAPVPTLNPFDVLKAATAAAPVAASQNPGVAVEPTEAARQQATYIDVCQALRRRHMGDDNSRAAGYGLYKFRVPVSVLPGRETHQGYSAVVTLRATVNVDEAQLRYTYPKLVIADLVDTLTPVLISIWTNKDPTVTQDKLKNLLNTIASKTSTLTQEIACLSNQESTFIDAQGLEAPNSLPWKKIGTQIDQTKNAIAHLQSLLDHINVYATLLQSYLQANPACDVIPAINSTSAQDVLDSFSDFLLKQSGCAQASVCNGVGSQPAQPISELKMLGIIRAAVESSDGKNPAVKAYSLAIPTDIPTSDVLAVYGSDVIYRLRNLAQQTIQTRYSIKATPQPQEIRAFLFGYLGQVENVMEKNDLFSGGREATIVDLGKIAARGDYAHLKDAYAEWTSSCIEAGINSEFITTTRALALQTGILEVNLKKILDELRVQGKLSNEQCGFCQDDSLQAPFHFFNVGGLQYHAQAISLWQLIVREEFPLHVFTLDAQVEEQNAYDAFSRQRQLQLALAYNVATGRFNTQQKLAMSRELQLDESTIALNRTVVGFSHGEDTFGWYFYPRIQTPPTEKSNIAAVARVIWQGGPSDHYDIKHRELEPGMRECEVLIAMPAFITKVSFDVTTNWERLTVPGTTKRSYETMLNQGERIQHLKSLLDSVGNQGCYRPGDYERMRSRAEQLEAMLGMQTYLVNVPYTYEQSGTDLFDKGDVHLRPSLTGYYGLQFLDVPAAAAAGGSAAAAATTTNGLVTGPVTVNLAAGTTATTSSTSPAASGSSTPDTSARMFLTGKNFHPTLTYVIVGGALSTINSSIATATTGGVAPSADVTVINRELLEVKINKLDASLSNKSFEVRVGTPAGLSDPIIIAQAAPAASTNGFTFKPDQTLQAQINKKSCDGALCFRDNSPQIKIVANLDGPLPVDVGHPRLIGRISAAKADGTAITFGSDQQKTIDVGPIMLAASDWQAAGSPTLLVNFPSFRAALQDALSRHSPSDITQPFDIKLTGYILFDAWPMEKTTNTITVHVEPDCVDSGAAGCKTAEPDGTDASLRMPSFDARTRAVPESIGNVQYMPTPLQSIHGPDDSDIGQSQNVPPIPNPGVLNRKGETKRVGQDY